MGNKVVIEAELATKTFDRQIDEIEGRLMEIDQMLSHPKEFMLSDTDIAKLNVEAEKLNNKLSGVYEKQLKLSETHAFEGIGKSISGVIGKVVRWSIALIGIRTVINAIRGAMSILTQQDEQLGTQVDYMRWALANAIKPVVEWIINTLYSIAKIVAKIIYTFTGYNIFQNSGIDDYQKAMAKSNKSAKELKKTLMGFDEMNILNKDGSTGTAGVGIPKDDLSKLNTDEGKILEKLGKKTVENYKKMMNARDEMAESLKDTSAYDKAFGGWSYFVQGIVQIGISIFDFIKGAAQTVGGLLDIIVGIFTLDGEKILGGVKWVGKGIWDLIKSVLELIVGLLKTIIGIIVGLVVELWNVISGIIMGVAGFVFDWIIKPVGDFFVGMWNGIVDGAKGAWDGIKQAFSYVATFFKDIFGKAWEGVKSIFSTGGRIFMGIVDGILNGFKKIVNAIIDGINKVVAIPFNGINSALNSLRKVDLWGWKPFEWVPEIKVPQIPRLAKGGIINYPGAGVMVGGANVGEAGQEGVIPLTDSQQMELLGQSIGKYITVNLTNVTELDGRTIARKVQEVSNGTNFLMNR